MIMANRYLRASLKLVFITTRKEAPSITLGGGGEGDWGGRAVQLQAGMSVGAGWVSPAATASGVPLSQEGESIFLQASLQTVHGPKRAHFKLGFCHFCVCVLAPSLTEFPVPSKTFELGPPEDVGMVRGLA